MTEPVGDVPVGPAPEPGKPYLNASAYDKLKAVALIWLPALGALYAAVALIWGLPATEQVLLTVTAVDTFLGAVLKTSNSRYNASPSAFGGILTVEPDHENGVTNVLPSVNREALAHALDRGQTEIRLKLEDRT